MIKLQSKYNHKVILELIKNIFRFFNLCVDK